ncbi:hypothetical protein D3C75_575770 [compost metagenome]
MATAKGGRKVDIQAPGDLAAACNHSLLQAVYFVQDGNPAVEVTLAFRGRGQTAGGAMQQFGAELLLQPGYALANGGTGQSQPVTRRGKGACPQCLDKLHDPQKDRLALFHCGIK